MYTRAPRYTEVLPALWDYGHFGLALKKNIEDLWWRRFVLSRDDMYGIDSAILMNSKVWEASGHIGGFHDPLVEDKKTHKRYRADHLLEDTGIDTAGMSVEQMGALIAEKKNKKSGRQRTHSTTAIQYDV